MSKAGTHTQGILRVPKYEPVLTKQSYKILSVIYLLSLEQSG